MAHYSEQETAPTIAYQRFLRDGKLQLQVCEDCTRQIYFPRTLCNHCGSGNMTWQAASGDGTVYSTTTVRRKAERGGDYNLAIIQLAEGARMMSRVDGLASSAVTIGMQVSAAIVIENDSPLVVFHPVRGAGA